MYVRLALIFALLALCVGVGYCDSDKEDQTGLTVTGVGEVQSVPDRAFLTLGVRTEDRDAAKAAQDNATLNSAVVNAVTKAGIAKNDIQTANYTVAPNIDYSSGKPVNRGYYVTNDIRVKVRDLTKVGAVIDAALGAGANEFRNLSFGIEDDTKLRQEALTKAAQDAEQKAGTIAAALGVTLMGPKTISEAGGVTPPVPIMRSMAKVGSAPETSILAGENTVTATLTVVYAVSVKPGALPSK